MLSSGYYSRVAMVDKTIKSFVGLCKARSSKCQVVSLGYVCLQRTCHLDHRYSPFFPPSIKMLQQWWTRYHFLEITCWWCIPFQVFWSGHALSCKKEGNHTTITYRTRMLTFNSITHTHPLSYGVSLDPRSWKVHSLVQLQLPQAVLQAISMLWLQEIWGT